jgi:A/G-specific adenine glycosylase
MPLIENTLDLQNPREWYYALTDYGAYLKTTIKFINTGSKHYSKQSTFEGSRRQMRGMILKTLLTKGPLSLGQIKKQIPGDDRIISILKDLTKEKLIVLNGKNYSIDSGSGSE